MLEKESCTGCSACTSVCPQNCIKLTVDGNGFLHPDLSEQAWCINCKFCENVCPIQNGSQLSENHPQAYAAWSCNEKIRAESSSGGVFSELAKIVFFQNGVVYGASYDENFFVKHICIETEEELSKLRGAKYAQSDLGNSFIEIRNRLNNNQKVLFSGTPCQVAGLKSFLRKDYENLICVDFVCHGVPSPMAWKEYVKYRSQIDASGQLPKKINLRSKISGWSRYRYSNLYEYSNENTYTAMSGNDLYMKLFVGDYISRESCSDCQFKGYSRLSDITLGDFWGIWDLAPEMDDDKGTSLVLVQSEKGRKIFSEIADRICSKEMTLEQASMQNPSLLKSSPAKANRQEVLDIIREGRIGELENLFTKPQKEKSSLLHRIVRKVTRR